MAYGQGHRLSYEKIEKIKLLLAATDLTMPEIAKRMGCTGGSVSAINRKFGIRSYDFKGKTWHTQK